MRLALIGAVIVAALGGLLFGFDTAVISGTTDWLKKEFNLSYFSLGFTVASALIGTILGSLAVGEPSDKLGRRTVLFILAVLYFISGVGCALAWDWGSFMVFRFLGGLAVGGASVVSPMYIAEISPANYRGRLVAVTQFNIVLGVLLAYFSNYIIGSLHLGANECRWMFGVMAVPSAVFFFLLVFTPQSPRWLVARGRVEEARGVLQMCGSDSGNLDEEIREIQASLSRFSCVGEESWTKQYFSFSGRITRRRFWYLLFVATILSAIIVPFSLSNNLMGGIITLMGIVVVTWIVLARDVRRLHDLGYSGWAMLIMCIPFIGGLFLFIWLGFCKGTEVPNVYGDEPSKTNDEVFFTRKYRKPILLAVAIAMFNQLSGINAVVYYTKHIFEMAGCASADALLQSVIVGFVNLLCTMTALSVIDHFGRRKLMIIGSIGYIISLGAVAACFYSGGGGKLLLISLILFIASHAAGQGTVIWVFISEIFPNRVRASGQALGSFTHWFMAAAISWTFPIIASASGWMTFAFYAFCCVGQLVWVLTTMPETKGISLEKIQKELGIE